jgi:phage terminase large subunit
MNEIVKGAIANAEFPEKLSVLFDKSRYKVLFGGRGGAKSWGVARALLILGCKSQLRILCAREFQTSIKDSVHKLLSDQVNSLGLSSFYEVLQNGIRGANGTEFSFVGLKNNTANIKSYEGVDIVWVEEAQSVSRNSWNILIPTIRKQNSEIWITFNPELETDETFQRFVVHPPEDAIVRKINWSDNPWFPETLNLERIALKNRDPEAYNTVWEGICRVTVDGAIFAKEMQQAERNNQITKIPYDAIKSVHCVWDLGWADHTAIWFIQFIGMEIRVIRYMQNNQQTISWYLAEIQKFGYHFDTMWLPHDAASKNLGTGRSIEEIVRSSGYKVQILDRVPVTDSINAARTIFSRCYFDRENCDEGLQCLRHYRYDVDEDGSWSQKPLHDQYSHGADAFRMLGLMVNEPKKVKPKKVYIESGSWMG